MQGKRDEKEEKAVIEDMRKFIRSKATDPSFSLTKQERDSVTTCAFLTKAGSGVFPAAVTYIGMAGVVRNQRVRMGISAAIGLGAALLGGPSLKEQRLQCTYHLATERESKLGVLARNHARLRYPNVPFLKHLEGHDAAFTERHGLHASGVELGQSFEEEQRQPQPQQEEDEQRRVSVPSPSPSTGYGHLPRRSPMPVGAQRVRELQPEREPVETDVDSSRAASSPFGFARDDDDQPADTARWRSEDGSPSSWGSGWDSSVSSGWGGGSGSRSGDGEVVQDLESWGSEFESSNRGSGKWR